jgi:hypothetical protein
MKLLRSVGIGLAGTMVMAAVLQLAAPRAVYSTVAALVNVVGNVAVTNPPSASGGPQPLVVQDAEVKALQAYRQVIDCTVDATGACTTAVAQVTGTQVLVINDVSGICTLPANDFIATARFYLEPAMSAPKETQNEFAPGSIPYVFTPEAGLGPVSGATNYTFGRQTYIVLDSMYTTLGSDLEIASPTSAGSGSGSGKGPAATCTVTYSGYYVHQ